MLASTVRLFTTTVLALLLQTSVAQQSGGPPAPPNGGAPGPANTAPTPGRTVPTRPTTPERPTFERPIFVSGSVVISDGAPLPEPAVIEQVCNGSARRQGYTDFKGQFQFQLNQPNGMIQDASESGFGDFGGLTPGMGTQRSGGFGQTGTTNRLLGCELRAMLPGFRSNSVLLIPEGNISNLRVDTIVLQRIGPVEGTTVSMTTMQAPKDAKHAYEKAQKDFRKNKLADAEKELKKAVELYPQFAAAWSLLGAIHEQQNQLEQALADYAKALSADSRYVNPYFGLAIIASREKKWQDVLHYTNEVARLNPFAFPEAYFYSAAANYNLGNFDAAEKSARKFQSVDTEHRRPEVDLLLGKILIIKHDYAGAAEREKHYLAIAPNASNADAIRADVKRLESLVPQSGAKDPEPHH